MRVGGEEDSLDALLTVSSPRVGVSPETATAAALSTGTATAAVAVAAAVGGTTAGKGTDEQRY